MRISLHCVLSPTNGLVLSDLPTALAGLASVSGSSDGSGTTARFFDPYALALGGGKLYVLDQSNFRIRIVTTTGRS